MAAVNRNDPETLRQAVSELLMSLWNIQAVAELMDRVPEIHDSDFTGEIAGGVRVIRDLAAMTADKFEGIP